MTYAPDFKPTASEFEETVRRMKDKDPGKQRVRGLLMQFATLDKFTLRPKCMARFTRPQAGFLLVQGTL